MIIHFIISRIGGGDHARQFRYQGGLFSLLAVEVGAVISVIATVLGTKLFRSPGFD